MNECDILGGQNMLRPLLHIFKGVSTPNLPWSTYVAEADSELQWILAAIWDWYELYGPAAFIDVARSVAGRCWASASGCTLIHRPPSTSTCCVPCPLPVCWRSSRNFRPSLYSSAARWPSWAFSAAAERVSTAPASSVLSVAPLLSLLLLLLLWLLFIIDVVVVFKFIFFVYSF